MEIKNEKLKSKKINVGIELLRFILCFWIVINHCSIKKEEHKKYLRRDFHVPAFMMISFYFFYPYIKDRNMLKIIARFQRLLYPYILWPIIIFILNNVLIKTTKYPLFKAKLTLKDFIIQIIIGVRYHGIFWFLFNLIFISLFLTIIFFIFKDYSFIFLDYFGIISLYINFSKKNLYLFISYHKDIQKAIGSLVELLPLAIIGCISSSFNLILNIQKISFYYYVILLTILYYLFEYDIFILPQGFMYPNIVLNIVSSFLLFIIFGSVNPDNIIYSNSLMKYITRYTGGIYYIHQLFRNYFQKYILFFSKKSYTSACLIYIICYIICYIGSKLFNKYRLKYLFL